MSERLERALLELAAAFRQELAEGAKPAPDRLLSIPEAAAALGIGRTCLYGELDAGRLRSIRVGRRRLIPASAIAELAGNEIAARVAPRTATAEAPSVSAVRNEDTADVPPDGRRRAA